MEYPILVGSSVTSEEPTALYEEKCFELVNESPQLKTISMLNAHEVVARLPILADFVDWVIHCIQENQSVELTITSTHPNGETEVIRLNSAWKAK